MDESNANIGGKKEEREYVLNADGTVLLDHKEAPVTVDRFLASKPLRAEVSTRPGPGGKKLSYMSGDIITKTLNEAFGFDGWSLDVKQATREENVKDEKGRYHVAYIATVRITHQRSGVYREDCGSGDAIDKTLAAACGNALKGAITDAMKRAARHFGEKLGNSLYHDGFNPNKAPVTLKDAFETLDVERAQTRFGFDKNKQMERQQNVAGKQNKSSNITSNATIQNNVGGTSANDYATKQESAEASANKPQVKAEPVENINTYISNPQSFLAMRANSSFNPTAKTTSNNYDSSKEVPRAINAANQYSNLMTPAQRLVDVTSSNVTNIMITNSTNLSDHNPLNNISRTQRSSDSFPFSNLVATPAGVEESENVDPNLPSTGKGLDLPKRPGTSRGISSSQNNEASHSGVPATLNVAIGEVGDSVGLRYEQHKYSNLGQALKRKADGLELTENNVGAVAKVAGVGAGVRNPYNC
ncbi:hypothetical protein ACHAXS_007876 [Conticribra weissflogii]